MLQMRSRGENVTFGRGRSFGLDHRHDHEHRHDLLSASRLSSRTSGWANRSHSVHLLRYRVAGKAQDTFILRISGRSIDLHLASGADRFGVILDISNLPWECRRVSCQTRLADRRKPVCHQAQFNRSPNLLDHDGVEALWYCPFPETSAVWAGRPPHKCRRKHPNHSGEEYHRCFAILLESGSTYAPVEQNTDGLVYRRDAVVGCKNEQYDKRRMASGGVSGYFFLTGS